MCLLTRLLLITKNQCAYYYYIFFNNIKLWSQSLFVVAMMRENRSRLYACIVYIAFIITYLLLIFLVLPMDNFTRATLQ